MSDLPRSQRIELPAPASASSGVASTAVASEDARSGFARRPPALGEVPVERRRARPVAEALPARQVAAAASREEVRAVLGGAASLRTAVVVSAILGAPRALKPYGASELA